MPKQKKEKPLTPEDLMKLEIARDLGLEEKILTLGWGELSSEESGRIGGILSGRRRAQRKENDAVRSIGAQLRPVDEAGSAN